ncbi:MAG: DUF3810 family protein [Alphaproteobacteria bacterium]|nr:DUF3810 family protein [Alphaproteobacteria bacterium]
MERIVIPQKATHTPVALADLIVGAPMASRLLLATSGPGQVVMAGALGYYVGSAARDWFARRGVRPIDFQAAFGADVSTLIPMTNAQRREECRGLSERMSDAWTEEKIPREEAAVEINRLLTRFIANITGQEIITSDAIRGFTISRIAFPFAIGSCDAISGDVAIFQDTGILEPHVIAHEFCHRKGYLKELHAQAIAHLALRTSGNAVFVQAARAERLQRNLAVLSGRDPRLFDLELASLPLRSEVRKWLHQYGPSDEKPSRVSDALRKVYDQRMRLTGQNGISDYDRGFTDFLHTFRHSETATQPRSLTDW